MKIDSYYQKGRYSKKAVEERTPYLFSRAKLFAEILKSYSFEKVLDAGCGDGGLARFLEDRLRTKTYGVDISKKGVSIANMSGIKAKVSDLSEKIPFGSNFFDLIIANELIEHLENPDTFLRECRRTLRKNGILLISTPNLSFWLNRFLFLFGIYPMFLEASTEKKVGLGFLSSFSYSSQPIGHLRVFNLSSLYELLNIHGYNIEKIIGDSVAFVSPNYKWATSLYNALDRFFSQFPSLSSNLIIVAKKK